MLFTGMHAGGVYVAGSLHNIDSLNNASTTEDVQEAEGKARSDVLDENMSWVSACIVVRQVRQASNWP